jgi:hypothetical protein
VKESADPDVAMPLMAAYFARRVAILEDRAADADSLDEVLRNSAQAIGTSVLAAGAAAANSPLLPFRRAAVDQWVAASAVEGIPAPGVCLFSEASFIRAGYLQVSNAAVQYVESSRGADRLEEMLSPELVRETFERLWKLDSTPPEIGFPADDSGILELQLPAGLTAPDYRPNREGRWQLSLVRPGASRQSQPQSIRVHYQSLIESSPGRYTLKGSAELMMELHAGGANGYWLHLSTPEFALLGRMPDFCGEGGSTLASYQPQRLFAAALGHGSRPCVPVPAPLARRLLRRHLWCSASTISDWLHLMVDSVT